MSTTHPWPFQGRVEVDRKILADMAVHDPAAFGQLAQAAKDALGA
jgi:ribosomal protein L20